MSFYNNKKNRTCYPDSCFSINRYKYKRICEKINKLNKDFEIFLDANKKKIIKPKKKNYSLNINTLFKKQIFDSTNKVMKKNNNSNEKTNRIFFNAKQIQSYKDKKKAPVKSIKAKELNNNINSFSSIDIKSEKSLSRMNIFTNSLRSVKNNKNNNISIITNRSFLNQQYLKNIIYSQKYKNNKAKLNLKERLFGKNYYNKKLTHNRNKNNILKDYSSIKNSKNSSLLNTFFISKNNDTIENDNNFNNDYMKIDYKSLKKKVNLKRLKLNINKYENSTKYNPDSNKIYENLFKINKFINKKFIKNNRIDKSLIKKNEINRLLFDRIKRKKIYTPKTIKKINQTQIFRVKDNSNINRTISTINKYNVTNLIDKINKLQKELKAKKRIIKKEKNNKNNYVKKIINYFKSKSLSNSDINRAMKKDFLSYQNKIGYFVRIEDYYLYTSHLSIIFNNKKLNVKYYK